jgi:formylglycine-generating enzyme required for sulfatase activity/ribose 1,5-bisphosphokinase PhnN
MPDRLPTIRIFISSPSDVRPERLKAEQIIARLDREFAYHFHVEAVLWEREPLVATHHFQDSENIPEPRGSDIVVVILWSRLGVPLPADKFRGAISGRRPVTGTEWEFEDALAAAQAHGVPELLLYRKMASATATLDDRKALDERLTQLDLVEDFIGRWFRSADGESLSAASHSFGVTAEFEEQLYVHLHALLERRAGAAPEDVAIRWHQAPFRALLSYEYEDAPVFFGRTHARNSLRELLARQIERGAAFVLVFGASGSGKSSLVKAGLLPDLTLAGMIGRVGLVRRAVMRPSDIGSDPLAALATAILSPTALPELAGLHYTPERLRTLLNKLPEEAHLPIEQGLAEASKAANLAETAEARLVIVVDQLEEIFTIDGLGEEAREAFVAVLDALAKSGLVWIVATMRSDFFDRLETSAGLALARLAANEARYQLLPPNEAEIGQIIRQPAQEAGLRFEHDAASGLNLDEAIRQAAAGDRGALPLLSFLLDQLWQKRRDTGLLTFAAYQELGGLEGAIGRRAEEVFQAQPAAVQKELVPLLRALVTVRGTTATARAAPLSSFPVGSPRRALVDAFLDPEARLLVSDIDGGRAQLRLAHEALLTRWPRARDQIAADTRDLELRGRLEEEAKEWRLAARREKKGRVRPAGLPLKEARALIVRWGSELPAEISEFVAASRRTSWWRRTRLAAIVAGAVVAPPLIALLVWAGVEWRMARRVEAELKFVSVPAGCFEMGSPVNEPLRRENEGPVHRVCLQAFELGEFEVTQRQWRRVMHSNPSYYTGDESRPVDSVAWSDTQTFIRWMSFFGRHRYRLPSEAEYEYAERAGTTTPFYWGSRLEDACAHENIADLSKKKNYPEATVVNCDGGYATTAPVGSFKPNPWGLYDIDGNVGAWVADCYVDNYLQAPTDGSAGTTGDCETRVLRGGAANYYDAHILRSAFRAQLKWFAHSSVVGFRLVRTVTP